MYGRNPLAKLALSALGLGLAWPAPAGGGVSAFQLGEQDFSGAPHLVYDRDIRAAGAGEAYPFDGTLFGDDRRRRAFGRVQYTHTFDPAALGANGTTLRSATLTVGVIDLDSQPGAPGTVRLLFNGVPQPVDLLTGISAPGLTSSAQVVNLPVPVELLTGGQLTVQLEATRAAPGFRGNAIEVDFSRLTIDTTAPGDGNSGGTPGPPPGGGGNTGGGGGDGGGNNPPPGVPLPPGAIAGGAVLLVLAGYRRLRSRRERMVSNV